MPLPELYNDDGDDFIVIAHRGASAYYPENTMVAIEAAVSMNAEMIELDVMLSRDGEPVVFHDAILNRITSSSGELVNFDLDYLRQLDAGSWFDPRFSDQRIPTLGEVVSYARGKVALNIEIKTGAYANTTDDGIERKCVNQVRECGMERHVIFSSFNYEVIRRVKELAPEIPAALLYNRKQSGGKLPSELIRHYGADAFNCNYWQLNKRRYRDLRANGIPFFVYTIDSERRMKKLLNLGAAGIFTNKPDLLRMVLGRRLNKRKKP